MAFFNVQAAIEAVRILNLNSGTGFSGPYGDYFFSPMGLIPKSFTLPSTTAARLPVLKNHE